MKNILKNKINDEFKLKRRLYKRAYNKRTRLDPIINMVHICSVRIQKALKGELKANRTLRLIGCSSIDLKAHLESRFIKGMTWENYGQWHVDHIKPIALFNLADANQQKQCFHYTNLQPLWALDNILKRDNY